MLPLAPPADVLDLTAVPTTIRAARAESGKAGRRLIFETTGDREMLEDALRGASFRPAPDGAFRRTDEWGTLNVYTGANGATFVASTAPTAFGPLSKRSREAWKGDLTLALAGRPLVGFLVVTGPVLGGIVGLASRDEVKSMVEALDGRSVREGGTPPPQFVAGAQFGNEETKVFFLGFSPVDGKMDGSLGSFGNRPIVFVTVAAERFTGSR